VAYPTVTLCRRVLNAIEKKSISLSFFRYKHEIFTYIYEKFTQLYGEGIMVLTFPCRRNIDATNLDTPITVPQLTVTITLDICT
jgi:hypothetical protein